MTDWVLGVDGCRDGWIGVAWNGRAVLAVHCAAEIGELVHTARQGHLPAPAVVGIDIPIGLPDSRARACDRLAREALGSRASTLFITPVRAALAEPIYADALRVSRELTGVGISRQAFALRTKILQVDAYKDAAGVRAVEVHPELSFAAMAGQPLAESKKTWAGAARRRRLLADNDLVLPDDCGAAGVRAGVDDVLDAAAAAWSARRVLLGTAECLPPVPERFSDGVPAAIWC